MSILKKMETRSSVYSAIIVILLFSISTSFSAYAKEKKATLIRATTLGYYDFHENFTAVGQFKSEKSRTYHAKSSGTIDSISIIQGKNVSKGDALITIDENIAEATKSKAEAAFSSAKTTHNRDLSLLAKKIISKDVSDRSKVALEIARADLATALSKYEDMIIKAPFDGYVGVVRARTGDDIKAGDYLFSLVANAPKTIFIELPETMYHKVNDESDILVSDSEGMKISGRVIAVSDYLNDNGTITAKLEFPLGTKVLHGSYAEVEIIYSKHKGIAIPEKILMKNNEGNFVFKVNNENIIKKIYVTVGTRTDNMIEINSDELQIGDSIVLEGLTKVNDGSLIEIIKDIPNNEK